MDLNAAYPEVEQEARSAVAFPALEAVFGKIVGLTRTVRDPEVFGRKLFTPGLDRLVPELAARLNLADVPSTKSNDNVCILATEFYTTGGHTRVARDFAAGLSPDQRPMLVMTGTWGGTLKYRAALGDGKMLSVLKERLLLILSAGTLVEKTLELYMMLKAARPSRIILICHPFDLVAVVATWPFRDIVEFVHHCDHIPAVGAALPWSAHVDVTYTCHCACREKGVEAVYASMTATTVGSSSRVSDPNRVRMATCGDQRKFEGPARYRWTDYAVAALRQPGAELLHMGDVSEDVRQTIHQALSEAGIDPARYIFKGMVPSLPAALIENEVDLYLSSYPAPGGKANLEAMVAGVPVILPVDDGVPPLLHFRLPLKHYLEIGDPEEMATAIPAGLELGQAMRQADQLRSRDLETHRFEEFIAGRPTPSERIDDILNLANEVP